MLKFYFSGVFDEFFKLKFVETSEFLFKKNLKSRQETSKVAISDS